MACLRHEEFLPKPRRIDVIIILTICHMARSHIVPFCHAAQYGRTFKMLPHYAMWHTARQGHAAKSSHAASVCGCCVVSAVACHLMLRGLKIRSANCWSHDATTLFSVVLKTADRVGLTPAPANSVPTKGERVPYMIRRKYGSMRAAAAGNNFTSTSVLYCIS